MRHPFSYNFIFVLLNLSHALEMQLELLQRGGPRVSQAATTAMMPPKDGAISEGGKGL